MDTVRTARIAAVICIVSAAAAVALIVALLADRPPADMTPYLVPIYLAKIPVVAALAFTGAATGTVGRAGIAVTVAGLLGFVAAEVTAPGSVSDALYAVVPLVTALGLVLAGVAVLRSGRWSGWRRYVPLVTGAWIFVVVTPLIPLVGEPGVGAPAVIVASIGAWHLLWVALGVAVLAETGANAPARAVA